MYTIGELSRKSGLSRGTLLYYDEIGLLKPSARTDANYRRYSEVDAERLRQICLYRETGMPLDDIKEVLESAKNETDMILEKHLGELNEAIHRLEIQRQIIVRMLKKGKAQDATLNKHSLVTVLTKSGLDDAGLDRLHVEFERSFPEEHQAFLEFLGFNADEIKMIREHSKEMTE